MLIYQYVITGILGYLVINFLVNLFLFKNIKNYILPEEINSAPPLVSVLVPARNEEKNIRRCILSLLKQDYPNLEILVLNDNSTDDTGKIVENLAKKDSRLRIINGKPLKKGWLGKCWACHQLSGIAKGQYYIFTDADTLHYPDTVSKAFAAMLLNKLDAICVFPKQITVTFHERMTVPFIYFAILAFMPLVLVKKARGPFFSTGIGQFFMFKRQAYEKMGGHESVKAEILEDIHISKQIKRAGLKYMIFDGSRNIFCRMYRNFNEVISGFTKVIYSSFDYNAFTGIAAMTVFSLLFLMPFIFLPIGIIILNWSGVIVTLIIIQIMLIFTIKIALSMRFKNRVLDVLFSPVSMIYMLALTANSIIQAKFGKGVCWKGRTYGIDTPDELELREDNYKEV